MAVTLALHQHETLVVTAGGERTMLHGLCGQNLLALPRVLDAHDPGRAVSPRPHQTDIAPEVDIAVPDAGLAQQGGRAVGRVFLAKATEVDFHARLGQPHAGPLPLHHDPAHQRQRTFEQGRLGQLRLVKAPCVA